MITSWLPPHAGLDGTDLWNALVALSGQAIGLGHASLAFAPADPPASDAWCLMIEPGGSDGGFLVHVRSYPFRERHGLELDVADLPSLPAGLHQALFQGMVSALAEAVAPGQPGLLRLAGQNVLASFKDFAGSRIQWFAVRVTSEDGLAIELDLGAERAFLVRLVGDRLPVGAAVHARIAEQIEVPADITLGSISLTLGELAALEPGAVVVMAERPPSTMLVRIHGHRLDLAMGDDGWRCVGTQKANDFPARVRTYTQHGGQSMSDDAMAQGPEQAADPDVPEADAEMAGAATQAEDAGISVDALRLTIDFDVGRKSVPLAALAQWQNGTIVDLEPPALEDGVAVTIRCNGDVVGSGDLVRIDDRIAVRVTRFLLVS